MSDVLNFLLLTVVLLAPFALVATLASRARRGGVLRWHLDQFRFAAPMTGPLFENLRGEDADLRRIRHDADAIRTRFEQHPTWPDPGVRDERR